jgi:hypothetical protein
MSTGRQPKSKAEGAHKTLSKEKLEWIQLIVKHLELNLVDLSDALPSDADHAAYLHWTISGFFRTLEEAPGAGSDAIFNMFRQIADESIGEPIEWTADLNARRFALIDKKIEGSLAPAEQVELERLTKAMRRSVESELKLPLEGAKSLHRYLTEL